jgi:hypothetical protein
VTKALVVTLSVVTALTLCSLRSNAKVFDLRQKNLNQLRNADSFSVECKSDRTGVIDRETVDVDAATVTVEIPDSAPAVHHITQFLIDISDVKDRFGQPAIAVHLRLANWGRDVGLFFNGGRWYSRHDDQTTWTCAN